jgi:hypothetical protein
MFGITLILDSSGTFFLGREIARMNMNYRFVQKYPN